MKGVCLQNTPPKPVPVRVLCSVGAGLGASVGAVGDAGAGVGPVPCLRFSGAFAFWGAAGHPLPRPSPVLRSRCSSSHNYRSLEHGTGKITIIIILITLAWVQSAMAVEHRAAGVRLGSVDGPYGPPEALQLRRG